MTGSAPRPGLFAPEVVQTSSMDCGPAVLKCLAEGLGVRLDYGRLREACQTDLDGTSIDTLEDVACRLGLDAEQVMLPVDHLLLPGALVLPAIVVTRQSDGTPHFVVLWNRIGPRVQVMDPATGRRWPASAAFLDELFVHKTDVPAAAWRRWAGSEEYLAGLRLRMAAVGVGEALSRDLLAGALRDPGWRAIAALDAATRMVRGLITARALRRGEATRALVAALYARAKNEEPGVFRAVPATYWPAVPSLAAVDSAPGAELLLVRGAVVLRLRSASGARAFAASESSAGADAAGPEILAARAGPRARPALEILRRMRAAAAGSLVPLTLMVSLSATTVIVEALLLRGLLQAGERLAPGAQRAYLAGALLFFSVLVFVEVPLALGLARVGRRLELGLRVAFHEKLPRLGSRYFRSRPVSDMSERAHSLQALRVLPGLGANLLRGVLHVTFTVAGLLWLFPPGSPVILLAAVLGVALPFAGQQLLAERELRVRSHLGALGRFYLDALLGVVPVRTHGAERTVRREHATLRERWTESGLRFQRALVALQAGQGVAGLALSFAILWRYHAAGGDPAGALLLVYWALSLPVLGQELARLLAQYPLHRNVLLRALEPLSALSEEDFLRRDAELDEPSAPAPASAGTGAAVEFRDFSVQLGGHRVLEAVELELRPGEHVALVGASGAGKSTLLGCLLGWNRPAAGTLRVDGEPLDAGAVRRLRAQTAWVDAAVRLWNRTLAENLAYGSPAVHASQLAWALEQAELERVRDALPAGLDSPLGEAGALVSGGEGQRVRFARALLRPDIRLVLLDEPFRGLARSQRAALLARARAHWADATLLCVTHDVEETLGFDRIVVLERGRVVEQGAPGRLRETPGSRYRGLLAADRELREALWDAPSWRRFRLVGGRLEVTEAS